MKNRIIMRVPLSILLIVLGFEKYYIIYPSLNLIYLDSGFVQLRDSMGSRRFSISMSSKSKYLGSQPVFVAGGSSGVGLEVIKKLSAHGN